MSTDRTARRDRVLSRAAACLLHGAVFIGGAFLTSPVEYGVEAGAGGIEVHLVAALPAVRPGDAPNDAVPPEAPEPADGAAADLPPRLDPMVVPGSRAEPAQVPAPPALVAGDGSSPVPGKDPTTLHASGGARSQAGPAYIRNPAPAYPPLAKARGEEGLVLLRAEILPNGRCGQLQIAASSGYELLDAAAAQAIRIWRFRSARRAGQPVAAWVEIPVRFQLVDEGGLL